MLLYVIITPGKYYSLQMFFCKCFCLSLSILISDLNSILGDIGTQHCTEIVFLCHMYWFNVLIGSRGKRLFYFSCWTCGFSWDVLRQWWWGPLYAWHPFYGGRIDRYHTDHKKGSGREIFLSFTGPQLNMVKENITFQEKKHYQIYFHIEIWNIF